LVVLGVLAIRKIALAKEERGRGDRNQRIVRGVGAAAIRLLANLGDADELAARIRHPFLLPRKRRLRGGSCDRRDDVPDPGQRGEAVEGGAEAQRGVGVQEGGGPVEEGRAVAKADGPPEDWRGEGGAKAGGQGRELREGGSGKEREDVNEDVVGKGLHGCFNGSGRRATKCDAHSSERTKAVVRLHQDDCRVEVIRQVKYG